MPHSINSDVCEGIALCVEACPVDCINIGRGLNKKGTKYFYINFSTCIDCGVCFAVCPVKGAVIDEERPELQKN
ncbi:indolepyruvate ferredoxin oxidoreductase subunit alpha [Prochlorococcus marinus]|uniref:indolepyruvate ferredoxin oxidoreductase subunit alpha n=1 Tax=Prochlorococcus marinus TaxID=1219 RepID=UPI0022B504EB|nr:4Fe-4S dicluster domain-containing protein [Prochlorococcus marinus]